MKYRFQCPLHYILDSPHTWIFIIGYFRQYSANCNLPYLCTIANIKRIAGVVRVLVPLTRTRTRTIQVFFWSVTQRLSSIGRSLLYGTSAVSMLLNSNQKWMNPRFISQLKIPFHLSWVTLLIKSTNTNYRTVTNFYCITRRTIWIFCYHEISAPPFVYRGVQLVHLVGICIQPTTCFTHYHAAKRIQWWCRIDHSGYGWCRFCATSRRYWQSNESKHA